MFCFPTDITQCYRRPAGCKQVYCSCGRWQYKQEKDTDTLESFFFPQVQMIWQQAQLWLVRGQCGSLKSSTEAEVSVSLEKGIPFAYDVRRVRAARHALRYLWFSLPQMVFSYSGKWLESCHSFLVLSYFTYFPFLWPALGRKRSSKGALTHH